VGTLGEPGNTIMCLLSFTGPLQVVIGMCLRGLITKEVLEVEGLIAKEVLKMRGLIAKEVLEVLGLTAKEALEVRSIIKPFT